MTQMFDLAAAYTGESGTIFPLISRIAIDNRAAPLEGKTYIRATPFTGTTGLVSPVFRSDTGRAGHLPNNDFIVSTRRVFDFQTPRA